MNIKRIINRIPKKYWNLIAIVVVFGAICIYGFGDTWYINKYGIYTIGTITHVGDWVKGTYQINYVFYYEGKKYTSNGGWNDSISRRDEGRKFFLIFLADDPNRNHHLDFAPDCTSEPPPEGWKRIPQCK